MLEYLNSIESKIPEQCKNCHNDQQCCCINWFLDFKSQFTCTENVVAHLITINWDYNNHTVEELQKPLNKVMAKKWMVKTLLAHEQRGEILPDLGKGYHNHILVEGVNKPASQIHREVYNTVKNYVGHSRHVDVQSVKMSWLQDKKDYLTGKKFDPEKENKQNMDIIFRKEYGLQQ